jgi:putative alpha-1,2-mannosidase
MSSSTRGWTARLLAITAAGASAVLGLALGPAASAAPARPGTAAASTVMAVKDPASLVNPLIGTGAGGAVVGQVDTFPGAVTPFGMLQWSPDTPSRPDGGGYNYDDDSTLGLSLTHISGPGCATFGDVPILPTVGAVGSDPQSTTENFNHNQEQAVPGYYEAELGTPAINTQVSVNDRAGLGVFTYPATTQANLLFKAGDSANGNDAASVQVVGNNEVTGSSTSGHFCGSPGNYMVYFAAKFDQNFTSSGTWTPSGVNAGSDHASTNGPIKTPKLPTAATSAKGTNAKAAPKTLPAAASNRTEHPAKATGPGPVERKGPQSRLQQPNTSGPATGAWVTFDTTANPVVKAQVSISYVSEANAEANLSADNPGWDLQTLRTKTYHQWQQLLSKFQIGGGTSAQQQTFYTALYHAFTDPSLFSDANGQYMGFDDTVHQVAKGQGGEYANFSGWDIYRSEVPLMALADPTLTGDAMQSLVDEATQGGWLDKWPLANDYTGVMNGDAADPILAEALSLGVKNFDTSAALQAMIKGATQVPTASQLGQGWYEERPNLAAYEQLGYVPNTTATSISPVDNGTSETTEYAASDFAIAQFAAALGGHQQDYTQFMKRAQNWQNQFNPLTSYLQPRDAGGNYPFGDPLTVGQSSFGQSGYQEGDAAQYNFAVPQNLRGLFNAMGGNAAVVSRLDTYFTQLNAGPNAPYYWAGNETDLNNPWVYDYAGAPYKTQQTVRDIINTLYANTPGGEPGNDDLGAMSSWYVWAALGLYPQTPGSPVLALGSPLFPYAAVQLSGGHKLVIRAPAASASTPYVSKLTVNGRASQQDWVSADQLLRSPVTTLDYTLSSQPDPHWGAAAPDAPPSYTTGEAPAIGYLSSPEITVPPGGSATVKVGAQDVTGRGQTVGASVSAPSGPTGALTYWPASGSIRAPADGKGTLTVTVKAATDTPQTFYTVPVSLTDHGTKLPSLALTVLVAKPGSLLSAFSNDGISSDTDMAAANFDGDGYSYSQQALAAAGFTPGGTVSAGGVSFSWPLPAAGNPDNAIAGGQTVAVTAAAGTQTVGFLGSSTSGPSRGIATLTYSDGSTARYWLGLSDWTLNGGSQPVSFGNTTAASMTYRNCQTCSSSFQAATYVFEANLPVNPGKTLLSVTLPSQVDQGQLHVFAIGTSTTAMSGPVLTGVSPSPASAGQTVTITGSGFGSSQGHGYVAFGDLGSNWGGAGNAGETIDSWSDTSITFTVPAASGSAHVWAGSTATVAVVTDSGARSDTGVLEITPTSSMSDYYGNTGISSDDNQSCADLDGDGYSFSADALAKAGVTAGGTVTSGGVSFTWPASCQPDNVLAAGQTILVSGKSGATTIGFLGTSTDGATSGPVTVTYTDGTTSTSTLSFSDWAGTAAQGENTVASIPYRNSDTGTSQTLTISVYEMSLPLNAGKTVASVTLPYVGDSVDGVGAMHIFAIGQG